MNLTKKEKGSIVGALILSYNLVGDIENLMEWVSKETSENLQKVVDIKNKNNPEESLEDFFSSLLTDNIQMRESEKIALMESVFVKVVNSLLEDIIKEEDGKNDQIT